MYADDITEILGRRLLYHMYADDMQGHHTVVTALQVVTDIKERCSSIRLQLNVTETELL
jgi:hypothetical protein